MLKTPIYQVPVPSTDFASDAKMCGSILRFDYYRNEIAYRCGIRFKFVSALRERAEHAALRGTLREPTIH